MMKITFLNLFKSVSDNCMFKKETKSSIAFVFLLLCFASLSAQLNWNNVAFVHGSDSSLGSSGVGLSVWTLQDDDTFSRSEISFADFDRDGDGSEVFGHNASSQTFFVDVTNDSYLDIVLSLIHI